MDTHTLEPPFTSANSPIRMEDLFVVPTKTHDDKPWVPNVARTDDTMLQSPLSTSLFPLCYQKQGGAQLRVLRLWSTFLSVWGTSIISVFSHFASLETKTGPVEADLPLDFLAAHLAVKKLNDIHIFLLFASRRSTAYPLHMQAMLGRQIVVTEQPSLHLTFESDRIYIKPLPDFLLDPEMWRLFLCSDSTLYESAAGLMLSYTWLVHNQSDYKMAREHGLLPGPVTWEAWVKLGREFRTTERISNLENVNKRYMYGELSLSKLIWICWLTRSTPMQSPLKAHDSYSSFVSRNFAWLAVVFVYMTIVLTSMQVGLATDRLQNNLQFQRASYRFTVFCIVVPLFMITAMLLVSYVRLCYNSWGTLFAIGAMMVNHAQRKRRNRARAGNAEISI